MKFHPILHTRRNILLYIFFWFIIAAINVQIFVLNDYLGFSDAVIESLIFNFLLALFGISFWYAAKYISIEHSPLSRIVFIHLLGGVLLSVIWLASGYSIMTSVLGYNDAYQEFFLNSLPWRFMIGILIYFLITAFYYIVVYYTGFQERIIREADLKNLVTEAELKSLKFQINPHFIFNSLNSMSALTTIDPGRARDMIIKLADFLRYTLANNDKQKNKLSEELRNIRLYLEIEKIRFEDKFTYSEQADSAALMAEVPNMILQPMFENAIKHAVYETIDVVNLKLTAFVRDNYLTIILENNFEKGTSFGKKGAGIGLKNIRDRLFLIYQQNDLLEIKQSENIFKVTLNIPLVENEMLITN